MGCGHARARRPDPCTIIRNSGEIAKGRSWDEPPIHSAEIRATLDHPRDRVRVAGHLSVADTRSAGPRRTRRLEGRTFARLRMVDDLVRTDPSHDASPTDTGRRV